MQRNPQLLQQAINEGLLSLGEPIMKTIIWHLAAHGIFIDSKDQIDVRVLYNNLQQIVGNIADVIMNEIYEKLNTKSVLYIENSKSSEEPVIVRIEKLLQAGSKEDESVN